MNVIVKVDDKEYKLSVDREGNAFVVHLQNKRVRAEIAAPYHNAQMTLVVQDKLYSIVFDAENRLRVNEEEYTAEVFDEQIHRLMKASPAASEKKEVTVTVPMPGLVVEIEVHEGDTVKAGQGLIVVEAMKMQNEIKSPKDGIVRQIFVQKGQSVNSREKLMVIQ